MASQVVLVVKNLLASARDRRPGFDPWVRNTLWRRAQQPTPVFLPGENIMDRGAWQATVHRVTQSQTWLKWLTCNELWWYANVDRSRRKTVEKIRISKKKKKVNRDVWDKFQEEWLEKVWITKGVIGHRTKSNIGTVLWRSLKSTLICLSLICRQQTVQSQKTFKRVTWAQL